MLPSTTYRDHRHSTISQASDVSGPADDFYIPMALDPHPFPGPSPLTRHLLVDGPDAAARKPAGGPSRDYFTAKIPHARNRSQDRAGPTASRPLSRSESRAGSQPSSPHIACQEKGREPAADMRDTLRHRTASGPTAGDHSPMRSPSAEIPEMSARLSSCPDGPEDGGRFRLQEAPKPRRKSGAVTRVTTTERPDSDGTAVSDSPSSSAPTSASTQRSEQHPQQRRQQQQPPPSDMSVSTSDAADPPRTDALAATSPRVTHDPRAPEDGLRDQTNTHASPTSTTIPLLPQRSDSLPKPGVEHPLMSRKDAPAARTTTRTTTATHPAGPENASPIFPTASRSSQESTSPSSTHVNGGRVISRPIESPVSKSSADFMQPPARAKDRPMLARAATGDSFTSPRAPPHLPTDVPPHHQARAESISTLQSESTKNGDRPASPVLPPYSAGGEFTMADDMARILGHEASEPTSSLLRRGFQSVRHARSHSDRGIRLSKEPKWHKSPLNGIADSGPFRHDGGGGATSASPDHREPIGWLRAELRRERHKGVEKDERIAELEEELDAKTNLRHMNTELREKRSTMVVLDAQKEIVVRELEVLVEHIEATKRSREPLDLRDLSNAALREFAEALQKCKDDFAPQLEILVERKHALLDEIANATQLKDSVLQEFEQLSLKNAQLAELNNTLVYQVSGLQTTKAMVGPPAELAHQPPHGLGIYTQHPKDRPYVSVESRHPSITDGHASSGAPTLPEPDGDHGNYLATPQVVNIRKGQPKKFNWKRGGQNVAKGVTKGLKEVFTSNDQDKGEKARHRDGHRDNHSTLTEGIPYGAMQQQEYPSTTLTRSAGGNNDASRQAFGFFGNHKPKSGPVRSVPNGITPAVAVESSGPSYLAPVLTDVSFHR